MTLPLESERTNPDNYKTLSEYLEATGQVRLTSQTQLLKARNLYVTRGQSVDSIADQLDLDPNIIRRWIVSFDWKERRDRVMFRTFQRLSNIASRKSQDLDDRHNRIGGLIEEIIEDILAKHYDGEKLTGKELSALSRALRDMQQVRRTAQDRPTAKTESHHLVELDSSEAMRGAAVALSDVLGLSSRLLDKPKQRLQIEIGQAVDAEYEVTES